MVGRLPSVACSGPKQQGAGCGISQCETSATTLVSKVCYTGLHCHAEGSHFIQYTRDYRENKNPLTEIQGKVKEEQVRKSLQRETVVAR